MYCMLDGNSPRDGRPLAQAHHSGTYIAGLIGVANRQYRAIGC